MEGQRFFDLRRWGQAQTVLNAYLDLVAGGREKDRRAHLLAAEAVVERHSLYPIPAVQIELSKVGDTPMLTQNPGW
jgi:hypothetical protein